VFPQKSKRLFTNELSLPAATWYIKLVWISKFRAGGFPLRRHNDMDDYEARFNDVLLDISTAF
jgi:hypothetical protein